MSMLKIEIPEIHPSLNDWTKWHHYHRAQEKKRWEELVYYCALHTKPLAAETVKVEVRYYFPTKTARDLDNYCPKFLLDGLVKAGILKDDNSSVVKELSVKILYDKQNPRTEVIITDEETI